MKHYYMGEALEAILEHEVDLNFELKVLNKHSPQAKGVICIGDLIEHKFANELMTLYKSAILIYTKRFIK